MTYYMVISDLQEEELRIPLHILARVIVLLHSCTQLHLLFPLEFVIFIEFYLFLAKGLQNKIG